MELEVKPHFPPRCLPLILVTMVFHMLCLFCFLLNSSTNVCPFDAVVLTWIRTAGVISPNLQLGNLKFRDIVGPCKVHKAFTIW